MQNKIQLTLALLFISLGFFSPLQASEWHVDDTVTRQATFVSDAPFESFDGVTEKLDGYAQWHGEDFTAQSEFYFEVDLNAIDTGIGLRNRHMQQNYLETDRFPLAQYEGRVVAVRPQEAGPRALELEGRFSVHGVTQDLRVTADVVWIENRYHVHSRFNIRLNDYAIKIPAIMFYKINELVEVRVDFYLKAAEEG